MGVPLDRQVQGPVSRVQVGVTAVTVGPTGDHDRPEDGAQTSAVTALHTGPGHAVGVDDISQAGLVVGSQVQVVLEQATEHFAGFDVEAVLQVGVLQPGCLSTAQPRRHRLEQLTRRRKGVSRIHTRGHRRRPRWPPGRRARRPAMPASAWVSRAVRADS